MQILNMNLFNSHKYIWVIAIIVLFVSGCSSTPLSQAEKEARLQKQNEENIAKVIQLVPIKKIYLGDFGNSNGSGLVREKVRKALSESTRFEVVENPNSADAVMTGAAGVEKSYSGDANGGVTSYRGQGMLRLVGFKDEKTIWQFEYQNEFFWHSNKNVSAHVANQIVEKLLDDAKIADESIEKNPGSK